MPPSPRPTAAELLHEVWNFPLLEAVFGRRSRRFGRGMEIPDGPLAFTSRHPPLPLSELERTVLIAAATGVTGWHFGIPYTPAESPGGTYDPETPGPFLRTGEVKSQVKPYSEEFIACLGEMAQYIYDTYGKFPATIPTIFMRVCVQAHHLDTEFYDTHYEKGAYLEAHARHIARWHA